jgi:chromosome segregation ATPase
MTERLSLFRQQALRPYKRALWIMAIILILAIAGLVTWNILQAKKYDAELQDKQDQIEQVQQDLTASDALIDALNEELETTQNRSAAERARVQQKLEAAQAEREALLENAQLLNDQLQDAADVAAAAGQNVQDAQDKIDALQKQLDEANAKKAAEEAVQAEKEKKALKIYSGDDSAPVLKKEKEKVLKKF